MQPVQQVGQALRYAREGADLSQSELARRAGVSRGTIRNIEAEITTPSPGTLRRLSKIVPLDTPSFGVSGPVPLLGLSPRYDPIQMNKDMELALNGPGGTMEQTMSYVDPASATDFLEYANLPSYLQNYRSKIPVADFGEMIAKLGAGSGVDLIGLGVGDGKSETRLAEDLAGRLLPGALHCYWLDISHSLLIAAYQHALGALPPEVAVFPMHGNFHHLSEIVPLQLNPGRFRRRLWAMLGNTFGNLAHEPAFLKDVGACSRRGDLLLLDVLVVWAPAQDLAAVRKNDPALQPMTDDAQGNLRRQHLEKRDRWLKGPILRHCRGVRDVKLDLSVTNRCPLPGSYELVVTAHVNRPDGVRHFDLFRFRRYNPELLGRELADLGWVPRLTAKYGPEPGHMALLLLERR